METSYQTNTPDEFDEAKFIISKKKDQFRKQIRAKKQNELFYKKRFELLNSDISKKDNQDSQSESSIETSMSNFMSQTLVNETYLKEYLEKICMEIKSQYLRNEVDTEGIHQNMKILKIYSQKIDEYPEIATFVLDSKIVQTLQEIIKIPSLNLKNLQLDTAFIISNLTYSNQDNIEKLLDNNLSLIDVLVQMLKDQDNSFSKHAIFSLANMSQEYLDVRDEALKRGVAETIVEKYKHNKSNKGFIEEIIWFIAIFSVRPHPYELIRCFIPILDEQLGLANQSQENIKFIIESLKNLSEGDCDKIQAILEMKNIKKLLAYANKGQDKIPLNIYQIITNLTFGNPAQLKYLIDLEVLDYLSSGFEKISKNLKIEVCQSINNIFCSGSILIDYVINHRYLLTKMLAYIQTGNFTQKKELLLALGNFCMNGTVNQIHFLKQRGLFQILFDSFQYEDIEIMISSLNGISQLLQIGREISQNQQSNHYNQILIAFENLGLSAMLMKLQVHENQQIYEKCEYIITQFYEYS